jgi:hypothetical protein
LQKLFCNINQMALQKIILHPNADDNNDLNEMHVLNVMCVTKYLLCSVSDSDSFEIFLGTRSPH